MAKILLAWELGANYGHVSRCLHIAKVLRERGHAVLFAVRDTRVAEEVLAANGFPFLQAPLPIRRARLSRPSANYAEILLGEGYADSLTLRGMLRGWFSIMQSCGVETVLADHAPTALLATGIAGIPARAIGNGFAIPPETKPWPSIRPWEEIPEARLEHAEAHVETTIQAALQAFGKSGVSLRPLFANALFDTFVELDHYGVRDQAQYIGPIGTLPITAPKTVAWQTSGQPKVLAYLRPEVPGFMACMSAMRAAEIEAIVVAPGLSVAAAKRLASAKLRIAVRAIALESLLPAADLVVSYGGGGFTGEALLAGKPMLLLPQYVEQFLCAKRVEELGAGIAISQERQEILIATALQNLLSETNYRHRAESFARKYAEHRSEQALARVVSALETCCLSIRPHTLNA